MDEIALGFHFTPSKRELIEFLRLKARGEPLPSDGMILERGLYDAEPWNIFSDNDPWYIDDTDCNKKAPKLDVIYAFTKLSKMSLKKKKRTDGCGTCSGQRTDEIPKDSCVPIGIKKMFVFEVKGPCSDQLEAKFGHWIMHEYSLAGDSLRGIEHNDYVVCKITRKQKAGSNQLAILLHNEAEISNVYAANPTGFPGLGKRCSVSESEEEAARANKVAKSNLFGQKTPREYSNSAMSTTAGALELSNFVNCEGITSNNEDAIHGKKVSDTWEMINLENIEWLDFDCTADLVDNAFQPAGLRQDGGLQGARLCSEATSQDEQIKEHCVAPWQVEDFTDQSATTAPTEMEKEDLVRFADSLEQMMACEVDECTDPAIDGMADLAPFNSQPGNYQMPQPIGEEEVESCNGYVIGGLWLGYM